MIKNEKTKKDVMAGNFFHSVVDGKIQWQGHVIGEAQPGIYLVQLFEWAMGSPNVRRLVTIEDMRGWLFYETGEAMVHNYDYGQAKGIGESVKGISEPPKGKKSKPPEPAGAVVTTETPNQILEKLKVARQVKKGGEHEQAS